MCAAKTRGRTSARRGCPRRQLPIGATLQAASSRSCSLKEHVEHCHTGLGKVMELGSEPSEIRQQIDQLIFTSVKDVGSNGYQIDAASPGVTLDKLQEFAPSGAAHKSMRKTHSRFHNCNFHNLANGRICVCETIDVENESNRHDGGRVYTRTPGMKHEVLERLSNNALRLLPTATAAGHLDPVNVLPEALPAFPLSECSPDCRSSLVASDLGKRRALAWSTRYCRNREPASWPFDCRRRLPRRSICCRSTTAVTSRLLRDPDERDEDCCSSVRFLQTNMGAPSLAEVVPKGS